ncbi:iron complex outermembrane receptor protein [Dokdonella fugitiva]|uniref:Iron complex outermembrane receptor protein n=1 Tax=Dokdonella fugitiva TaxID=328517 RepID=A0A839ESX4_9GAMM|nr:TonB-dependent receptor [Dokdonella fugitiva]MBA8887557.1 iron complex outermembrane receptor protein [Dokdonella fugitiva]
MKRQKLFVAIACAFAFATAAVAAEPTDAATDAAAADAADAPGDDAATDPTRLEGVTVTARKREETLQDVPVAVTAFTSDRLDTLNVQDLSGLAGQVPNTTIYAARGSTSTVTAYIRGIGQSDPLWGVDPGVGIYLDDVYIARPQGALLDVFDVERVEVLRGPQGTLYGKNTIGGAIKYVSRKLDKDFGGYAQVTAGTDDELDAKAAVGGSFDANGMLRARLAVASLNRDGFGENLYTRQPVSDKQIDAARFNLGLYATETFDVQFAYDWMKDQSGVRGAQMLAANPLAPDYAPLDDRYDIRSAMPNVNDTDMKGTSLTANWMLGDAWFLKYVFAHRTSDTDTNIDFDTTPLPLVDVHAFYSDSQNSNELQLNYDGGGRARGVMGVYAFNGRAGGQVLNHFENPLLPATATNPLFGDTQGRVYTSSIAAYADWTVDLAEAWKLDLGARYTDEEKHAIALNRFYTDGSYATAWATAANFDKKVSFSNVSPKASIDWQVTPDALLYALYSKGFKSGGFNIRANTTAVPRSGEPFKDETVDSFEVGSKLSLLDQRMFLNVALFHNKYKDIQLSVFTSYTLPDGTQSFFGDFTNAGAGTINGAEVEYQFLPTPNWLISGNIAWLDASYDEFFDRGVNVADSQRFTNAPRVSGGVNVEYRTPLANGGNLSARIGYTYQSEVWPTTDLSPAIRQKGYGLLNAGVIWKIDDAWSVALQGTNLTDKAYRTTGYNIAAYGVLTGFYGPPRQVTLSATWRF